MVGPGELVLILIVVLFILLLWRGPQLLPQLGEALGKAIRGVRENINEDAGQPHDAGAGTPPADDMGDQAEDTGVTGDRADDEGARPGA